MRLVVCVLIFYILLYILHKLTKQTNKALLKPEDAIQDYSEAIKLLEGPLKKFYPLDFEMDVEEKLNEDNDDKKDNLKDDNDGFKIPKHYQSDYLKVKKKLPFGINKILYTAEMVKVFLILLGINQGWDESKMKDKNGWLGPQALLCIIFGEIRFEDILEEDGKGWLPINATGESDYEKNASLVIDRGKMSWLKAILNVL